MLDNKGFLLKLLVVIYLLVCDPVMNLLRILSRSNFPKKTNFLDVFSNIIQKLEWDTIGGIYWGFWETFIVIHCSLPSANSCAFSCTFEIYDSGKQQVCNKYRIFSQII